MLAYLARHYVFTLAVLIGERKHRRVSAFSLYQPTVSILIPARNEEHVIGRAMQGMTGLTYPKEKLQIIVINDASEDNTGSIAEQYARTHDHIAVVHRSSTEGGRGKASALNAVFEQTKGEIILCFDADYYPQRDIVEKLVKEFADQTTGAVQGRVTVMNEPRNIVTRLVALERIGGYRVDQQAREKLKLIPQLGGTVAGVRRSLLEQLGGWDESILAEDTDLTFRIRLQGYKVRYVIDAESYEEAVEDLKHYWRQRYRWAKGHMQCAFKHSLKVLKSDKLKPIEKIDGLLLLAIYFMPVLALVSCIASVSLLLLKPPQFTFHLLWSVVPISLYSFAGNFAPFFEVGIGAYLDGRTRAIWLLSFLMFAFLYNTLICTKALIDLTLAKILGRSSNHWHKTTHWGNGSGFVVN